MARTARIYALFTSFLIYSIPSGCLVHAAGVNTTDIRSAVGSSASVQASAGSQSDQGGFENYFSTPEECLRPCVYGQRPRTCYYRFAVEYYTTLSAACDVSLYDGNRSVVSLYGNQCILGDGTEKTVMVINRMLPAPSIQVCRHDRLVIDLENAADGSEVTIHWHGIFQNDYQYYDGVPHLTQCPITSAETFRYQFEVKNSGTHFYHSHVSEQMIDGLYGSLIVRDPPELDPHAHKFDEDRPDHVILISDYMHELSTEHMPGLYRHDRGQTAQNILINGKGDWVNPTTKQSTNIPLATFTVNPGKRYRFRLINSFATVCLAHYMIENHSMEIIAQDGANINPVTVNEIITAAGERVDFILYTNQTVGPYWMQLRGLGECSDKKVQQHAILIYSGGPQQPTTPKPDYDYPVSSGTVYNTLQSDKCDKEVVEGKVCINQLTTAEPISDRYFQVEPDYRIILNFGFYTYELPEPFVPGNGKAFFVAPDGAHLISTVKDIVYQPASAPLLTQYQGFKQVCGPKQPSDCTKPCSCSQVYDIQTGSLVELFVIDETPLPNLYHPFHLHGYEFKVFDVGKLDKNWTRDDKIRVLKEHNRKLQARAYSNPPGKDTIMVPKGGHTIVRFIANNPGYWLFHCHFSWHTATGMDVVLHVGTPEELPPVPKGFPQCYNWTPRPTFYS